MAQGSAQYTLELLDFNFFFYSPMNFAKYFLRL